MSARVVLSLDGTIVGEAALAKPAVVVGRYPDCDIVVEHPAISGRHMLLRTVGSTVYCEDLASTNGIFVNGVRTESQVLHHLDVIEIGQHKLHFFDEALLAGSVSDLERTVLTDFERTMIATQANREPQAAPPRPAAVAADPSRTQIIARDPAPEHPAPARAGPAIRVALRQIDPGSEERTVALDRQNTMIGELGADTALVLRRGRDFFIARLSGNRPPRLNGQALGPGTHPITVGDVVEVGGDSYQMIEASQETAVGPQR